MKKITTLILCFFSHFSFAASEKCFIAKERGEIISQEGNCAKRYSPSWSLPSGVDPYINVCKYNQNPSTWIRDSCAWYSRILMDKLGLTIMQDYVTKFSFGNADLTGGLQGAWISSSLEISPEEFVDFLQKVVDQKLPVSQQSYEFTKKIMYFTEMSGGWKLYGKTGNAHFRDKRGNMTKIQQGWFVGYISKSGRAIVFASHIEDDAQQSIFASFRARNLAQNNLWYLIDHIEK